MTESCHHARIKGTFVPGFMQSEEILKIRIHRNLPGDIFILNGFVAGLIRRAPNAILESIALWLFLLLKLSAYFKSNSCQSNNLLNLIHSLFGSSGNEPNISGNSSMETCPLYRLYVLSPPVGARFLTRISGFPCTCYTILWALSADFLIFWGIHKRY